MMRKQYLHDHKMLTMVLSAEWSADESNWLITVLVLTFSVAHKLK